MSNTEKITLDISLLKDYVGENDLASLQPQIDKVRTSLLERTCPGKE